MQILGHDRCMIVYMHDSGSPFYRDYGDRVPIIGGPHFTMTPVHMHK